MNFLEEIFYTVRDNLGNKIILFLIKHCHLYSSVFYAIGKKCEIEELELYVNQLKNFKER